MVGQPWTLVRFDDPIAGSRQVRHHEVEPNHGYPQGFGRALTQAVEKTLADEGERLLIVETSGTEDFAQARAFYEKCGYEKEAQIRDFYADGDDKIIFRKKL